MKLTMMIPGVLLGLALAFFGYTNLIAAPGSSTARQVVAANEQTQQFAIEKMTCAACPITVKKAMSKVAGVKSVNVDFDAKTATVEYDSAVTNTDEIAQASTNAGYPAAITDQG